MNIIMYKTTERKIWSIHRPGNFSGKIPIIFLQKIWNYLIAATGQGIFRRNTSIFFYKKITLFNRGQSSGNCLGILPVFLYRQIP